MSWCRWSTTCDNGMSSHLYVYEGVDGLHIHVAGRHLTNWQDGPKEMLESEMTKDNVQEWIQQFDDRSRWIGKYGIYEPIGLDYDGESFCLTTKEDIKNTFDMLKEAGYNFPERIYDYIDEFEEQE